MCDIRTFWRITWRIERIDSISTKIPLGDVAEYWTHISELTTILLPARVFNFLRGNNQDITVTNFLKPLSSIWWGCSGLSNWLYTSLLPSLPLRTVVNPRHPSQHTARLLKPAQVFPIASHSPSRPNTNIVLRQRTLGSFHRLLTSHWALVYLHA